MFLPRVTIKTVILAWMATIIAIFALSVDVSYASSLRNAGFEAKENEEVQKVSLVMMDVSAKSILKQVKKQTGLDYSIPSEAESDLQVLRISVEDLPVQDALTVMLNGTDYIYTITDGVIYIKKASKAKITSAKVFVKGVVFDYEADEPLAGATIYAPNTLTGVTTGVDGKYEIIVNKGEVLEISFLGKVTKMIVARSGVVNLSLKDDEMSIAQTVINAGYSKIDPRLNTSAISSVKMDDILNPGLQTVDMMLEGQVPGLTFVQNSGQLGAAPSLRVRGTSTIMGNRNPVWVLDGVIITDPVNVDPAQMNDLDFVNLLGNAISGLNPEDIEQIDVLKDASATALYGDAAANGVIVITTKKGKPGPPSIGYSFTSRYAPRPRYTNPTVNVMDSRERIAFSRSMIENRLGYPKVDSWVGYEAAYRDYINGHIGYSEFSNLVTKYETMNTDWFDILMQDSWSNKHTVNLSGGTDNTRYYASVGMDSAKGSVKGEKNDTYTAALNISGNYNKLTVHFGVTANISDKVYTPSSVGAVDFAYNTSRAVPAYNDDGSLWYYNKEKEVDGNIVLTPISILEDMANTERAIGQNGLNLQANIGYKFSNHLTGRVTAAYSFSNSLEEEWYGAKSSYSRSLRDIGKNDFIFSNWYEETLLPIGGELRRKSDDKDSYTARAQFDYNRPFGEDKEHTISASFGGELSSTEYNTFQQTIRGYDRERGHLFSGVDLNEDKFGDIEVEDGYEDYKKWLMSDEALGEIKITKNNKVSTYATLGYNYKNIYMLNANGRIDYSNKFGSRANEKSSPIWSVSGRWNIWDHLIKGSRAENIVSDLNIRSSFGYQGNAPTSPTQIILEKGGNSIVFQEYYSIVSSYPNPYLTWEKTENINVSLEFGLFNDRIRGDVSYYKRTTRNAFSTSDISEVNGLNSYTVNTANVQNEGFDVALNIDIFKSASFSKTGARGFSWRFDPRLGSVINKLIDKAIDGNDVEFSNRESESLTYKDYLNGTVQTQDKAIDGFYSYKFMGLDPKTGRPLFPMDKVTAEEFGAKFIEMTDEERYFYNMEYSGTKTPTLQGSFLNHFSYGRFALSINCSYSFGNKIRMLKLYSNISSADGTMAPAPMENLRDEMNDRWIKPGDEKYTNIPAILPNADFTNSVTGNPSASGEYWWLNSNYESKVDRKEIASNIWEMYDYSNARLVDGSYLKISSISFRYLLPEKFCRKVGFKTAYVSLNGTNLYTFCSKELNGQSPTQSGSAKNIPQAVIPTYTMGLNVTF